MRENRRFFIILASFFAGFVLVNLVIWKGWTEVLLSPHFAGGDLARLGFVSGVKNVRTTYDDLPSRHLEVKDYRGGRVDMITIGDSFSIGAGEGRNRYYQDYIATINGMTVLNIPTYKFEGITLGAMPVATLVALYNAGWLDRIKPRYVLVESVERFAIQRLVTAFDLNIRIKPEELERYYRTVKFGGSLNEDISFINEGNLKFLYYSFMYHFSEHAFRNLVFRLKLSQPQFSGKQGDVLLFHGEEVQSSPLATPQNIRTANDNLNTIARMLRSKGVTLIFMPVVDKLNLYRQFINDDRYPRSIFFEELRRLPKEYLLIDTKAILAKAIDEGELDLFYQDDTHWTWKASQRIFSSVRFAAPPAGADGPGRH
jgi:hypothetical protein